MKIRIQTSLLVIFFSVTFAFNNSNAQVTVAGSNGAANGTYTSLKLAFNSLNLIPNQSGKNITVTINAASYFAGTETSSCVLNQPSSASWTSLVITPIGAVTVSGAIAAGSPLIDLNGADDVTINGSNSGGNSLTISNTTISSNPGTSTIRFKSDAKNNVVTKCSVMGSSKTSSSFICGTIHFDANTVSGNDNNTISFCNIGPAGANLPSIGVYARGYPGINDNNTITNCNIYDFFSGTTFSSGIYILDGNTDYTVTNNKFYQSSARTLTLPNGVGHSAIKMVSSNLNNCTINNNVIGYANNSGTGTYSLLLNSSYFEFAPIYLFLGSAAVSNIQGNIITNISMAGTFNFTGFKGIVVYGGLVNIGNISGNIIGSSTIPGAITITNTGTNYDDPVYGIYFSQGTAPNISNNIVGGINVTSNAGIIIYCIRSDSYLTSVNSIQNNTIGFATAPIICNSLGSTESFLFGLYAKSPAALVSDNIVSNLTMISPNISLTGSSGPRLFGIISETGGMSVVSHNRVHSLSNFYNTDKSTIYGIYSSNDNIIERNFIHSFNTLPNGFLSDLAGIVMYRTKVCQNNFIRLGIDSSGSSNTNKCKITGILHDPFDTTNSKVYNNSVYIGGVGVNSNNTSNSFAFNSNRPNVKIDIRNNIFYNARSNGSGTGKHYAIYLNNSSTDTAGLTLNNNLYYATGTGGVLGLAQTLDLPDLNSWKNYYNRDNQSVSGNPQYINPNGNVSAIDLHINPSLQTQVESSGANIASVINDYDGQIRSGLTPVDIGADAGNFILLDLTGPVINYDLLSNGLVVSQRSFTGVNISDLRGVNGSSGTRPRVYYKRTTDANTFINNTNGTSGWKYVQANGSVSPFDFTINYSLLNGGSVNVGTVIQYFVVAQDLYTTPNTGIKSGQFFSAPASVALTSTAFPISGTINEYDIIGDPLAGDYTIGSTLFNRLSGKNITFEKKVKKVMKEIFVYDEANLNRDRLKDYTVPNSRNIPGSKMEMKEVEEVTFIPMENGEVYNGPLYIKRSENPNLPIDAGAGVFATITAAVNDLEIRGVDDAVRFLLLDSNYPSESFPIIINPITGSSATNTLSIKPNTGVTSRIYNPVSYVETFTISASHVKIDGSNINGGHSRDLTFEIGVPFSYYYYPISFRSDLTPITNSGIENTIVNGGIFVGNYFTNINIQNNDIKKAYFGIDCYAYSWLPGNGNGLTINSNNLNSTDTNSIIHGGIQIQGIDGAVISGNDIGNFETNYYAESDFGIYLSSGTKNTIVEKNIIHELSYTGSFSTGGGGRGIFVFTEVFNSNNVIANNMIYNISGVGEIITFLNNYENNPIGIFVRGSQTGVKIYNNSINLYGNAMINPRAMSVGIHIDADGVCDIRNNNISNSLGLSGTTGIGTVGIFCLGNPTLSTINNNNFHIDAPGSGQNNIGRIDSIGYSALSSWKAATGKDSNSVTGNPLFISNTNLHIVSTGGSPTSNAGVPIAGITTDFDNELRNSQTPDIGADEFGVSTNKILNLIIFIEGFYNSNLNSMIQDTARVYLRNNSSPYAIVDSAKANLSSTGTGIFSFSNASNGINYYIHVKHRNSIETWNSSGQSFSSNTLSYDFSLSSSQAYGNNMIQIDAAPLRFAIYSGDVDQDGTIDISDVSVIDNDSYSFTNGYAVTDLNGDNAVDISDAAIADNNAFNFVSKIRP